MGAPYCEAARVRASLHGTLAERRVTRERDARYPSLGVDKQEIIQTRADALTSEPASITRWSNEPR